MKPSGKKVRTAPSEFSGAGAGQIELDGPMAFIDDRLNRVEQAGKALNFINEDGVHVASRQSLRELIGITGKGQVRGFVGQIDSHVRSQGVDERRFARLSWPKQQHAFSRWIQQVGESSWDHLGLRVLITTWLFYAVLCPYVNIQ